MSPDIFLDDFERTEHSDALHAMLGRALIMATRFDSMCKAASLHVELRKVVPSLRDEQDRSVLLNEIADRHRSLHASIRSLELPKDVSVLLFDANSARNAVAHDLAKGLTGCLDIKVDEVSLVKEVSELIFDLAYGDVVISQTIGLLNGQPSPRPEVISSYVAKIVQWVTET